ncbi:hypothetical protein [Chryseobacterium kwangjuense]|uniref:Uncharacterized protein n=1 Tax=Chryseobacterium kwangjuense TaxID=267125 RepID=A0A135W6J9_9FLAO|nr:hypothetical protein [Chryseobacterium kwangjuense]KXH80553.1 hypothetical protein AU378_19375 [Chryseobacterium kwangjuense]
MKKTILLILLFFFAGLYSQNTEYQFKFDVKKFRKEYIKNKKHPPQLKIFGPDGRELIFNIAESKTSEQPVQNINTFKGVSADGTKIISFILTKTYLSGSYADQGTEIYFGPVANKKDVYKVYIPVKIQNGQEQDFVK